MGGALVTELVHGGFQRRVFRGLMIQLMDNSGCSGVVELIVVVNDGYQWLMMDISG